MSFANVRYANIPISPGVGVPYAHIYSWGGWAHFVRRRDGVVVQVRPGWVARRLKKLYGPTGRGRGRR